MSTGDDEGLVARPVDDSLLGERDKVAAALFGRQASPKTIGRYAIEDVLGRGAMGVVYEAWDEELQRTVAVKLISRDVEMGDDGFVYVLLEHNDTGSVWRLVPR